MMVELGIVFSPDGGHLYEQIYEYVKREIREGRLPQGERLPSTRSLASYLQISRSTVELAYSQLLSEGYLKARRSSGYYVCAIDNLFHLGELERSGGKRSERGKTGRAWQGTAAAKPFSGETPSETPEAAMIDFSTRRIDMSHFPYATWKKITKNTLVDARSEMFALGEPSGDPPLREAIARYLHFSRGLGCRAEQIVVGAGNDYLLMLLRHILGEGRRIAMENPTYLRAYRIFRSFGYEVAPVAMDGQGMRADALETCGCDLAYVMPAHQYPTGTVMPITRRAELLGWAAGGEGRYLIEDDYDSEFRYRGKPIPPLQASDRFGRVIYIGTFSKAIAPAIRISFMVLPPPLLERYERSCRFFSSTVSRIDQSILCEFMRSGCFERYLNKMRNLYRAKHDLMLQGLKPLRERFAVGGAGAGLHLLLEERDWKMLPQEQREAVRRRELELAQLAAQTGVRVYPLSDNRMPEETAGAESPQAACTLLRPTLLLGYAPLSPEQIEEGLRRLTQAWR